MIANKVYGNRQVRLPNSKLTRWLTGVANVLSMTTKQDA